MIKNTFYTNSLWRVLFFPLLVLLVVPSHPSRAQATLGARAIAVGQATTALPENESSVFENPAMISEKQASVSFFGIRYYGLAELTDMSAIINLPTKIGVIGAGAHRYGNDLFNENRLRLAYKNSFKRFYYGLALNYNHVTQGGGYGSFGALGVDAGIAAAITPSLWIGAKATNLNRASYGEINDIVEEIPRNLSIGFSFKLSDLALFTTDVLKDVNFPLSYRGGVEVTVIDHLKARAGITTKPQTFSAGFGYSTKSWGANVVVQKHEVQALGYSPGLDFQISW